MPAKIFPVAESRLIEIWEYTLRGWGEDQADAHLRELVATIHALDAHRSRWRRVPNKTLVGLLNDLPSVRSGVLAKRIKDGEAVNALTMLEIFGAKCCSSACNCGSHNQTVIVVETVPSVDRNG